MEKQHAYSVSEAEKLLASLRKAEAFVTRYERRDPWEEYRRQAHPINRAFEADRRRIEQEVANAAYYFEREFQGVVLTDLLAQTEPTQDSEQFILAEAKTLLDEVQARNDEALSLAASGQDDLITTQFKEEAAIVVGALSRLLKGPLFVSAETLSKHELVKSGDSAKKIADARTSVFYGNQHALNAHSFRGILEDTLAPLFKQLVDKRSERRMKLVEANKATKEANLKRPSEKTVNEANFRVGNQEASTLQKILGQCRDFFVRRMAIDPDYATYVDIDDLTFEDFKLALAAAPRALQDLAFEALRAFQHQELLRVLTITMKFGEFTASGEHPEYDLLDQGITRGLKGLGTFSGGNFIPDVRCVRPNTGKIGGVPTKTFLTGLDIGNDQMANQAKNTFLYKCRVGVEEPKKIDPEGVYSDLKFLACSGRISGMKLRSSKLMAFEGSLRECELSAVSITAFKGDLQSSYLKGCSLEVGSGFTAEAGVFVGVEIKANTGAKFKGVSFHDSKFAFQAEDHGVVFEACDFTDQFFEPDQLIHVAQRSKGCEFSQQQLSQLAERGLTASEIDAKDSNLVEQSINRVLANDNGVVNDLETWDTLLPQPKGADVDMLHPERRALKGVPPSEVLSEAGLDKDFDPRNIAAPLNRETIGQLPVRVRAYQALADFIKAHPKIEAINFEKWWDFFRTLGTETVTACFGIDAQILAIEGAYFDVLPESMPVIIERYEGKLKRVATGKDSLKELNGRLMVKNAWDHRKSHEISRFTKHQWLKQKLHRYLLNLHKFGLYINGLVEKGYVYPELSEDAKGFELEGLVHPDVHAKLGDQVQGNDVTLPKSGSVVNISSALNNDGKSTLQATIALAVSQAQSGLPVPAKIARLNAAATYDAIMVMPNTRADAGQGDGVMRERVKTYAALRERVQAAQGQTILVLMDEISMGATNARQASTFDTNTVLEVVNGFPGVEATVIAIVQDAEEIVPRWQSSLGHERVKVLTHKEANLPFQFVESTTAISSKPDAILEEMGMSHLMADSGWKVTE